MTVRPNLVKLLPPTPGLSKGRSRRCSGLMAIVRLAMRLVTDTVGS